VRNMAASYFALSELHAPLFFLPRGDAPRYARRLPLAIIFRAFGAKWPDATKPPLRR
jgi:hypothetical protein